MSAKDGARGDASPEGAPQGTSGEAAAPGGVPGYAGVRAVLGRCNMRNLLKFYARVTHQASLASGLFVERGDLVDALRRCVSRQRDVIMLRDVSVPRNGSYRVTEYAKHIPLIAPRYAQRIGSVTSKR